MILQQKKEQVFEALLQLLFGIPVDSEYVVFIVDTSGSMKDIWNKVTRHIENVINIHPTVINSFRF